MQPLFIYANHTGQSHRVRMMSNRVTMRRRKPTAITTQTHIGTGDVVGLGVT